jgi:hypothetical protein
MDILRCRRLNHWGAWISPSSTLPFFLDSLPVTECCCLGSRASFRFHCHSDSSTPPPSCILIVFFCLLCYHPPPLPTHNVHADVFAFAAAPRCLHHHSHTTITSQPTATTRPRSTRQPLS